MLPAMILLQSGDPDPAQIQRIVMSMLAILPVLILLGIAIILVPFWFICKKAGFSPWLSLVCIIPGGTLVLLYVLAFAEWKLPANVRAWPGQPPYPPTYPPQV
jgi:peptidoglycan/LPS O-acetylase OafA/YrhL